MISTQARAAFFRRIHLFHALKDEDLEEIAKLVEESAWDAGQTVFKQGADADRFYIIYQGTVRIAQAEAGGERALAVLVHGDYFGEEALLARRTRSATVRVLDKVNLFSIKRAEFLALVKRFPKLKVAFDVSVASRQLARKIRFDWLRPDEVVYFLARKHEIILGRALSAPILALVAPVLLVAYFFLTHSFFAIFGAGLLILLIIGWAVWNWIDWGNDFYIVTNQRAIWLEKVIGLYDSRQEAPLSTLLSVGVETDITGRLLDYGTVIVRTYVGKIPFSHVAHPYEAAHIIEEQWSRSKQSASHLEKEAMRNVLRQKMGLAVTANPADASIAEKLAPPSIYRRSTLKVIMDRWFKLRLEDSGTITYRKHWYVLVRQTLQPSVLILLVAFGMVARLATLARTPGQRLFDAAKTPPIDTTMLALPILLIPLMAWWIYQYVDWRNDIFQVTPDQILDIDKKPFGTEARRAAPLENILSTESERKGLAGYILNYGTVYITVGAAHLDFEDVLDPTTVQADIDRRREARVAQKREAEAAAERERMSDWLVAYHENEGELRQHDGPREAGPKSG